MTIDKSNNELLEAIIDKIGLEMTMHAIGEICAEKAAHIALNWQDTATAKVWAKGGAIVDVAAIKIKSLEI